MNKTDEEKYGWLDTINNSNDIDFLLNHIEICVWGLTKGVSEEAEVSYKAQIQACKKRIKEMVK